MIIGDKEINVYLDEILVDNLEPNLDQPRRRELRRELEKKGLDESKATQPDGIELSSRFEELVKAIVENRGISMPLVVEKTDGKFRVIDGDRRLGAVRYILGNENLLGYNPGLKERLSKLPCLVIKDVLSDEERARLLAHIHVHIEQWRPITKGDVIEEIIREVGEPEKAAAIMGVTKYKITKEMEIKEMEKRFPFKGAAATSYARELMSISKSLLGKDAIDATVTKVKEGIIRSPLEIRRLRKILADPDARDVYIEKGATLQDAEEKIRHKEFIESLQKPNIEFEALLDRLVTSLKSITFDELVKYKGNKDVKKILEDAIAVLKNFEGYV